MSTRRERLDRRLSSLPPGEVVRLARWLPPRQRRGLLTRYQRSRKMGPLRYAAMHTNTEAIRSHLRENPHDTLAMRALADAHQEADTPHGHEQAVQWRLTADMADHLPHLAGRLLTPGSHGDRPGWYAPEHVAGLREAADWHAARGTPDDRRRAANLRTQADLRAPFRPNPTLADHYADDIRRAGVRPASGPVSHYAEMGVGQHGPIFENREYSPYPGASEPRTAVFGDGSHAYFGSSEHREGLYPQDSADLAGAALDRARSDIPYHIYPFHAGFLHFLESHHPEGADAAARLVRLWEAHHGKRHVS